MRKLKDVKPGELFISHGMGVIYMDGDYSENESREIIDKFIRVFYEEHGSKIHTPVVGPPYYFNIYKNAEYTGICDRKSDVDTELLVSVTMSVNSPKPIEEYWGDRYGRKFKQDESEDDMFSYDPRFKDIRFIMNIFETDFYEYYNDTFMFRMEDTHHINKTLDFNLIKEKTITLSHSENIISTGFIPLLSCAMIDTIMKHYTYECFYSVDKQGNKLPQRLDSFMIMRLVCTYNRNFVTNKNHN